MDQSIGLLLTEILKSGALNEYEILVIIMAFVFLVKKTPFFAIKQNDEKKENDTSEKHENVSDEKLLEISNDISSIRHSLENIKYQIEHVNTRVEAISTAIENSDLKVANQLHKLKEFYDHK